MASSLGQQFEQAKQKLNTLKEDPGNVAKLKIYGLFKQATIGKCNTSKPSMFDMVGKAKWDAWNALGSMSKEDAQGKYIEFIDELAGASKADPVEVPQQTGTYETLLLVKHGGLATITLNRPAKRNAINIKMYEEISKALDEIANDDSITVAVTTGAGEYYCSGNDLSVFMEFGSGDVAESAKKGGVILNKFVSSFIDFPKPLIAAINGPAVGISVTVLALYDAVYASDKATFHTPFTNLGQSPEGCSSYLFPRLMGAAKANEMLMFNRKLTAKEACDRGLVAEVFPDSSFKMEVEARFKEWAKLPKQSLLYSKAVNRNMEKALLHKVNDVECNNLVERWQSEDCINAITSFFNRKSQL